MAVDAVVIGAGHNGLVAATMLARAGWSVEVLERSDSVGGAIGSIRTDRGYLHDWGAAFYGVLHTSPVLRELGLDRRVEWARTPSPVAALWDPARPAAVMAAQPEATAAGLGADGPAWLDMVAWWHRLGAPLFRSLMGPVVAPLALARLATRLNGPREAVLTARMMLEPVEAWLHEQYDGDAARLLVAGHATHSDVAIDAAGSTPAALLLTLAAQTHGMPVPVGGAGMLAAALSDAAEEAGVVIRTGAEVVRIDVRKGRAVGVVTKDGTTTAVRRAVVADVAPAALARDLVGEDNLPPAWLASLGRHRTASGYFRLDLDLSAPTPWADARVADSGVVHLTGDLDEIALSQAQVRRSLLPREPQLILGQQDRADPSRVPAGAASLWVECHCPATPAGDAAGDLAQDWAAAFADRMIARIEAHAPGLRDLIVDTSLATPLDLAAKDPNLVGGDVGGGSAAPDQLMVFRPVAGWSPYALPVAGLYMCGAASHPGGGVHGMCGRNAARQVLRDARLHRTGLRRRSGRSALSRGKR